MSNVEERLEVKVSELVFAKDCKYFIALRMNEDGLRVRTEVSHPSSTPEFERNSFYFDVNMNSTLSLHLEAFVFMGESEDPSNGKLLGDCIVELNTSEYLARLKRGDMIQVPGAFMRKGTNVGEYLLEIRTASLEDMLNATQGGRLKPQLFPSDNDVGQNVNSTSTLSVMLRSLSNMPAQLVQDSNTLLVKILLENTVTGDSEVAVPSTPIKVNNSILTWADSISFRHIFNNIVYNNNLGSLMEAFNSLNISFSLYSISDGNDENLLSKISFPLKNIKPFNFYHLRLPFKLNNSTNNTSSSLSRSGVSNSTILLETSLCFIDESFVSQVVYIDQPELVLHNEEEKKSDDNEQYIFAIDVVSKENVSSIINNQNYPEIFLVNGDNKQQLLENLNNAFEENNDNTNRLNSHIFLSPLKSGVKNNLRTSIIWPLKTSLPIIDDSTKSNLFPGSSILPLQRNLIERQNVSIVMRIFSLNSNSSSLYRFIGSSVLTVPSTILTSVAPISLRQPIEFIEGYHTLESSKRKSTFSITFRFSAPPVTPFISVPVNNINNDETKSNENGELRSLTQWKKTPVEPKSNTNNVQTSGNTTGITGNDNELRNELTRKQAMIEQLLQEVEKRTNAIKQCGSEIVALRKSKNELKTERDELQLRLNNMEEMQSKRSEEALATLNINSGVNNLSKEELLRHFISLSQQLQTIQHKYGVLSKKYRESKRILSQTEKLRHDYQELQKAHLMQSSVIQKIQSQQSKIGTYQSTIQMQEKVISRLEHLIEKKLNQRKRRKKEEARSRAILNEGKAKELEYEIEKLEEENDALRDRIKTMARNQRSNSNGEYQRGGSSSLNEEIESLQIQLEAKNERIRALEEQMIANASAATKEITALKMRLYEAEMETTMSFTTNMQSLRSQTNNSIFGDESPRLPDTIYENSGRDLMEQHDPKYQSSNHNSRPNSKTGKRIESLIRPLSGEGNYK